MSGGLSAKLVTVLVATLSVSAIAAAVSTWMAREVSPSLAFTVATMSLVAATVSAILLLIFFSTLPVPRKRKK